MLEHVVVARFKKGVSEFEIADMEKGLEGLPPVISEIKGFQCGRDVLRSERSHDFGLVAVFEDLEAMQRYLVHPVHLEAAAKLRAISDSVIVVDFEI